MGSGKILSFDDIRGYGFIVPDGGGADVFVHANELRDEKSMFRPGTPVEFDVVDSGRGPKAYSVRVAGGPEAGPEGILLDTPPHGTAEAVPTEHQPAAPAAAVPLHRPVEMLAAREYSRELTELFLDALPELTGGQIIRLRTALLANARRHGWLEN